jgi:beta-carotene/zeaxanthin 4-ketolase
MHPLPNGHLWGWIDRDWTLRHSPLNLVLWWILPLTLSSIQLFIFGTYLPHRQSESENTHRAWTIDYPLCLSFLSCYHFGYHWEHHEYPRTPWYRIPAIYLKTRSFGKI